MRAEIICYKYVWHRNMQHFYTFTVHTHIHIFTYYFSDDCNDNTRADHRVTLHTIFIRRENIYCSHSFLLQLKKRNVKMGIEDLYANIPGSPATIIAAMWWHNRYRGRRASEVQSAFQNCFCYTLRMLHGPLEVYRLPFRCIRTSTLSLIH